MSELIWERIGYIVVGAVSGLIYSLVLVIVLYPFIPSQNILLIIEVFVVIFSIAGLLSGELIFKSIQGCIYALYVFYGYLLALFAPAFITPNDQDIFPQKTSSIFFVSLGIFAGIICLFLIYL